MKLTVGLSTLPLFTIAVAVACGGASAPPSATDTSSPVDTPTAAQGDCGPFLRPGPIAFNGTVVSAGELIGGYPDYDNGWQVIKVRVETAALEASRAYSPGTVVDVNIIDPFFPIVAAGDCVAAAGSERAFPLVGFRIGRIAHDNFGFVADDFDVLAAD